MKRSKSKGLRSLWDIIFTTGIRGPGSKAGDYVRVGMDDFALKLLGKADAMELPLMGKELNRDLPGWGLKRKENLADVLFSGVNGVIMEVNGVLRERPALANEKPYEDGWLFMVRTPDVKGTVKKLMADTESVDWMNGEIGGETGSHGGRGGGTPGSRRRIFRR